MKMRLRVRDPNQVKEPVPKNWVMSECGLFRFLQEGDIIQSGDQVSNGDAWIPARTIGNEVFHYASKNKCYRRRVWRLLVKSERVELGDQWLDRDCWKNCYANIGSTQKFGHPHRRRVQS